MTYWIYATGALHSSSAFVAPARPAAVSHWLRSVVPKTAPTPATYAGHQAPPRGSLLKRYAVDTAASSEVSEVQADAGAAVDAEGGIAESASPTEESLGAPAKVEEAVGEEATAEGEGAEEEMMESSARTVWTKEELVGSEWKIGIMWEGKSKPQETWIRFKEGVSEIRYCGILASLDG